MVISIYLMEKHWTKTTEISLMVMLELAILVKGKMLKMYSSLKVRLLFLPRMTNSFTFLPVVEKKEFLCTLMIRLP